MRKKAVYLLGAVLAVSLIMTATFVAAKASSGNPWKSILSVFIEDQPVNVTIQDQRTHTFVVFSDEELGPLTNKVTIINVDGYKTIHIFFDGEGDGNGQTHVKLEYGVEDSLANEEIFFFYDYITWDERGDIHTFEVKGPLLRIKIFNSDFLGNCWDVTVIIYAQTM